MVEYSIGGLGRYVLRGIHYSREYAKLDAIFMVDDPGRIASPNYVHRFTKTSRLIIERFGRVNTLFKVDGGKCQIPRRVINPWFVQVRLDIRRALPLVLLRQQ